MQAYRKLEEEKTKQAYELHRFSSWMIMKPHLSKEDQNKFDTPQKIFPFHWDKPTTTPSTEKLTPEEIHQLRRITWGNAVAQQKLVGSS
jgi:hypothetical protein